MITHLRGIRPGEIRALVGPAPLILEIGAHDGSDTAEFLRAMPGARVFCFEPDERPLARLRLRFRDDPRVTICPMAISDHSGVEKWHASTGKAGHMQDWDYSGSVNRPTGHLDRSKEIGFHAPVEIACTTLDSYVALCPEIGAIDFIWADVQGAQRKVLAGAVKALAKTRFLYIECHATPLYDGETTEADLYQLLSGFEPAAKYAENLLFRNRSTV